MTILQSWSQGVEVWGRDGMRKLWSAANVNVYGGGVSEVEFLSELSQLYLPTVEVFVRELLAPTYWRSLDGRRRTWCPQWWSHAEAIVRLDALWRRAWEHLRLEPSLGISVWLRDHADPHMATLMDPDDPFKGCSPEKGHGGRLSPLPCDAAAAGLF